MRWSFVLTAVLFAAGCGGPETVDDLPPELRTSSVVSLRSPGAAIPAGASFAILPASTATVAEDSPWTARETAQGIARALTTALEQRGFTRGAGSQAEVQVGFLVSLGEALPTDSIATRFGLSAGLPDAAGPTHYEKGTLLVDMIVGGRRAWRGVVQVRTAFDRGFSESIRQERLARTIDALLNRMPVR